MVLDVHRLGLMETGWWDTHHALPTIVDHRVRAEATVEFVLKEGVAQQLL